MCSVMPSSIPALALARVRTRFGGGADQGRLGMSLFQVFADRHGLADHRAVVELEGRHLSARILIRVGSASILAAEEIDLARVEGNVLLRHEHAHEAGIGSEGIDKASREYS